MFKKRFRILPSFCWLFCLLSCFGQAAQNVETEALSHLASDYAEYEYDRGTFVRVGEAMVNRTASVAQSIATSLETAAEVVNRISSFGVMTSGRDAALGITGGLGSQMRGFVPLGSTPGGVRTHNQRLSLRLGPLMMDSFTLGVAGLYSEFDGGLPWVFAPPTNGDSEPNFSSMVWLHSRAGVVLSDRLALTFNPSVYYLPLQNRVGWWVMGPTTGLSAMLAPNVIFKGAFRSRLTENLNLVVTDSITGLYPQSQLLSNMPYVMAQYGDISPIDYAGRTFFGSGAGEQLDWVGSGRLGAGRLSFRPENVIFMNHLNARVAGRHSNSITSNTYYDSIGFWDHNFKNYQNWQALGTLWLQDNPAFKPHARYEAASQDQFRSYYQYGYAGLNKALGPNLNAHLGGGWLWYTYTRGKVSDTWLGNGGIHQRLGRYTHHGLEAGRGVMGNMLSRNLANYAYYYLRQVVGPRSEMVVFAQKANYDALNLSGVGWAPRRSSAVGLALLATPTSRLSMMLGATMEKVDLKAYDDVAWDNWLYQFMLNYRLTNTLFANLYYQYQDLSTENAQLGDFSEHTLYMGLNKQF